MGGKQSVIPPEKLELTHITKIGRRKLLRKLFALLGNKLFQTSTVRGFNT